MKKLLALVLLSMGCGQASPLSKFETKTNVPTSFPSPYPSPYYTPAPGVTPSPSPSPTSATSFYTKCVSLSSCKKLSTALILGKCELYAKKTRVYTTEAELDKALKHCKK